MAIENLLTAAAEKEAEIRQYLSSGMPKRRLLNMGDPMRIKAISRIAARLRQLQQLLVKPSLSAEERSSKGTLQITESIQRVIEQIPNALDSLDFDTAWELADALKQELLRVADQHYLAARLQSEWRRDDKTSTDHWSRYFPEEKFKSVVETFSEVDSKPSQAARTRAVRWLTLLYDIRTNDGRNGRALATLRSQHLRRTSILLSVAVAVLAIGVYQIEVRARMRAETTVLAVDRSALELREAFDAYVAGGDVQSLPDAPTYERAKSAVTELSKIGSANFRSLTKDLETISETLGKQGSDEAEAFRESILAFLTLTKPVSEAAVRSSVGFVLLTTVFAGAVGNVLAGLYRLRDHPTHIRALRNFRWQLYAMPPIGVAAALVLYVILKSGLFSFGQVPTSDENWALFAAAGFLAGYSEPFFLGTIGRISGGIKDA